MKKLDPSIALLAVAAFLAPIMGGYLDVASEASSPGFGSVVTGLYSYQACGLAHGLLDLLVLSALGIVLARRQVAQFPQFRILVCLGTFLGLMVLSITISSYRMLSLITFAEWAMYGLAFITVCAAAGRHGGPKQICAAFVAGCTFAALAGCWEYVTQKDPTWRIMHFWQDPNALAGVLVLGLFTAIGLAFSLSKLKSLACLLAGGIIGTALLLTQSKGGLGAAMAGFLFLFVAIGFYSRERAGARIGALLLPVLLVLLFTPIVQMFQRSVATPTSTGPANVSQLQPPQGAAPLSRLLNPATTAEQSAGFRLNLWKGCAWLIEHDPIGYGAGTYRFQSAKPGNTTETKLAHNTFLQLAVEISVAGALAFALFLLFCAYEMFRSSRKLPENQNLFRMGIFAALLASAVHNMVDCDLYFAGVGLSFFMLIGIGLDLSSDAILPELIRAPSKAVFGGVGALCTLFLIYAGMVQLKIEWLRSELGTPEAVSDAASLRSFCPIDYRVWYESVPTASSPEESRQFATSAVENGPTTADCHRLAIVDLRLGLEQAALSALREALKLDPKNLVALDTMLQIQQKNDLAAAKATAQQMVDIERTPYFSTRALPDVVPTETYEAREYLALGTDDPAGKVGLLRPAVQGFLNYANTTVPQIIQLSEAGAAVFGSPKEAVNKLSGAITAARTLADAYRALKDSGDATWAEAAEGTLTKSLDDVGKSLSSSK